MTELMKLKIDRDICYAYACAAYGKSFIDAQLYEPDDDTLECREAIMRLRREMTPICKTTYEYGSTIVEGLWQEEEIYESPWQEEEEIYEDKMFKRVMEID